MPSFNRRQFLFATVAGCGTLFLPKLAWGALKLAAPMEEPHFFLYITLPGGADQSYLFDARPLAMTAAGKIQNYLGEEPRLYLGVNGGSCLATSLTAPLDPFRSRFSVINGVLMATSFDGHDQNMKYLLTGNPFGGESFIPHLNQHSAQPVLPLDSLAQSFGFGGISNESGTVILDPSSVETLKSSLAKLPSLDAGTELGAFLAGRLGAIGSGAGRFSRGAKAMQAGLEKTPDFKNRLLHLDAPNPKDPPELQFVTLLGGAFRHSMARSATLTLTEALDTHAYEQAKEQPKMFASIASKLAGIFRAMSETPFDGQRSLLDVTTVLVSSEFGRTMRIEGSPVDRTGTNHNSLTNTMLVGGKGIKGGMVIGASDFASAEESLSKAHLQLDASREKTMGRPFDFDRMAPRTEQPETFDPSHYLTAGSVVNTFYHLFGVGEGRYRTLDRDGTKAPLLRGLLG